MSTHTPGPWGYTLTGRITKRNEHGQGRDIAKVHDAQSFQEYQANIYLIAAAPDLFYACQATIRALNNMTTEQFARGRDKAIRDILLSAISKATRQEK